MEGHPIQVGSSRNPSRVDCVTFQIKGCNTNQDKSYQSLFSANRLLRKPGLRTMRACAKKSWTRVFNLKMSTEKNEYFIYECPKWNSIKRVGIFAGSLPRGKWDGDFNGQSSRDIVQYGYMYFSFIF